ncbi:MAG: ferritin-like domain-containing protein [Burkholderiales bacterium]|nr:ferritin-like domain-containing protein [Burkholderiales bacterium]
MIEKGHKNWRLEDIDFSMLRRELVVNDERLFYLLASASFVEILSEIYTDNLIEHYRGNDDAALWLKQTWQREELQHGRSLKAYVKAVWPEFDWEASFSGFAAEYGLLCSMSNLESSRALEMMARCVVETGTSTLYRCLYDYAKEPVLKHILANIKADEVRHYAKFRRLFIELNHAENKGALAALHVIWKRMLEIHGEDGYIAFKHAHRCRCGASESLDRDWIGFKNGLNALVRRHYPFHMAVEMLLSPVPLSSRMKRMLGFPLTGLARIAVIIQGAAF